METIEISDDESLPNEPEMSFGAIQIIRETVLSLFCLIMTYLTNLLFGVESWLEVD
jgi:hypothetical protein